MGLDISYYRNLKPVACDRRDECDHIVLRDSGFDGRMEPFDAGCYEGERVEGFRAGSYGGYSAWRDKLAELAGYPRVAADDLPAEDRRYADTHPYSAGAWYHAETSDLPFIELVNFSDREGTIGPIAAKELAADFATFDERAKTHFDHYGYERYTHWRKAFETAANENGAVDFH